MLRRQTPAEVDAWRRRSKPLTRSGGLPSGGRLSVDPVRYDQGRRINGSTLRGRSPTLAAYYADVRVRTVRDLIGRVGACQAPMLYQLAGETDPLPRCGGPLDVHERRSRGRGGSLEHPDNLTVVCRAHHDRCGVAGRDTAEHHAGLVSFEGDPGYETLGARRGERKQR